jgi:hypothetical protein
MSRRPINDEPMTSTERSRRRRERLLDERAEQERIMTTYFDGRPPLTEAERREAARKWGWRLGD